MKNEMSRMYEMMLALPSMDEPVKLNQSVLRKHVLLLCLLIEEGLRSEHPEIRDLLSAMPKEVPDELMALSTDYLEKAGLTQLSQKLKGFNRQ